jgi:hypothetical protein
MLVPSPLTWAHKIEKETITLNSSGRNLQQKQYHSAQSLPKSRVMVWPAHI